MGYIDTKPLTQLFWMIVGFGAFLATVVFLFGFGIYLIVT